MSEEERVKRVYKDIDRICREFGAEKVILFGSRAKGTALERSDIDIAVYGVENMPGFEEAIDNINTLYTIDIVDMNSCKNENLISDIERYGCKISEAI